MKPQEPKDPKRSALMSRVRQKGTAAERIVGSIIRELGSSYRLNVRSLPGSPDFANKKRRWATFVHGCFWHQHPGCSRATIPKTNAAFWIDKFKANKSRDERAIRDLEFAGYEVIVVWECEIGQPTRLRNRLSKILEPR